VEAEDDVVAEIFGQLRWRRPLQTLSAIPGVQLRVFWEGSIADLGHPCIDQWLKQHGQLISHLEVQVQVSGDRLKLREFTEAATPCKAIDLTIYHSPNQTVNLADLAPLAGSLLGLACKCQPDDLNGRLRGTSALTGMSQLTSLFLKCEDVSGEELWSPLAKLTDLKQLSLAVIAHGDPSPLSALTELSYLEVGSLEWYGEDVPAPFSFSSLEPVSTLQQLEVLQLGGYACAATSLQGLAGLSKLKLLGILSAHPGSLRSLQGISTGVMQLTIMNEPDLVSLAGIEGCTSLQMLSLESCGVSSLQPLRGLSSMEQLMVVECFNTSLEGMNCMSLQSLCFRQCSSLVQLSGVEHLSALKSLELMQCGVNSLQPLSQLGTGLQKLRVLWCSRVQEEVLEMPHVQPTANLVVMFSNVREVVLAGGVRRAVGPPRWRGMGPSY
jgi:Leucine-rich repeat (LRR) protein